MLTSRALFFTIGILLTLGITGCTTRPAPDTTRTPCYIVYDAGSSGTRMYLYEVTETELREHEGPKVSALADPVREIRGKSWADADAVTTAVAATLDTIQSQGPLDDKGQPKWAAVDWPARCEVVSASVYATAGMRIAEHENREKSAELWQMLKRKLQAKLGNNVKVNTRTLSGYEEGLFTWLAVNKSDKKTDFGIAEMGGASSQITFPCPHCDLTDDAVNLITLDGQTLPIYSYSFLGLGQDEAPKSLGFPTACAYGIGQTQTGWKVDACASQISLMGAEGIRDPYNFSGKKRGRHNQLPPQQANIKNWFLTSSFNYTDESHITTCCETQGQCYDAENACFRAVYFKKYLEIFNIPASSTRTHASWTQGAVICQQNDCLQAADALVCRWSVDGCL